MKLVAFLKIIEPFSIRKLSWEPELAKKKFFFFFPVLHPAVLSIISFNYKVLILFSVFKETCY